MIKQEFLDALQAEVDTFNSAISTPNGDWIIKGFIDIAKNIYTLKSTYRIDGDRVNGMTLGAFTGYFVTTYHHKSC
jgi:hypothetical protein